MNRNSFAVAFIEITRAESGLFIISFLVLLHAWEPHLLQAQDIPGSSDHPLISRYEGSEIVDYSIEEFSDYYLLTGPAKNYGGIGQNMEVTTTLEGKVTRITYRTPADRSSLEVFRNYETALSEAGFETIFQCDRENCGGRNFNHAASPQNYYMGFGEYYDEQRYLATSLNRPEGQAYVSLYLVLNRSGGGPDRNHVLVQLDVIELEAMDNQMVFADADAMLQGLETNGRIALYGILFEYNEDTIHPDSEPQLDEIARFLSDHPGLQVFIVGHTDNRGSHEYNLDLSRRRANRVVETLVNRHGIDSGRLISAGIGMLSPVATNRTEEGRTLNRRVEIVER